MPLVAGALRSGGCSARCCPPERSLGVGRLARVVALDAHRERDLAERERTMDEMKRARTRHGSDERNEWISRVIARTGSRETLSGCPRTRCNAKAAPARPATAGGAAHLCTVGAKHTRVRPKHDHHCISNRAHHRARPDRPPCPTPWATRANGAVSRHARAVAAVPSAMPASRPRGGRSAARKNTIQ